MTNPASTKNGKASLHGSFDRKRLGVISAILLGACVLPATGASAAGCEPGPEEVSFFQHTNYKGTCSVLGVGTYANSKALRVRNDTISSIKVGRAVNVMVCKHIFGPGSGKICQTFKKSILSFKNQRIKNDSISAASIFLKTDVRLPSKDGACKPKPNQATVAVYQHYQYKGNCRVLSLGIYRNSKEMEFKNDSISSIEFGRNSKVRIKVCQHSNFKGRCENLRASLSSLYTSKVGDNQITSIRVTRKPGTRPAPQ